MKTRYVRVYWQEASDPEVKGYYAVDKYGVHHQINKEEANRLKKLMKPRKVRTNVMTLGGWIYDVIWEIE